MFSITSAKTATSHVVDSDDDPKWHVEHSVSDRAGCQQAACKRAGVKIAKGELRIGTQVWVDVDEKYTILGNGKIESLLDSFEQLPEEYKTVAQDSFATGAVTEPQNPGPRPAKKAKSIKASQKKLAIAEDDVELAYTHAAQTNKAPGLRGKGQTKRYANAVDIVEKAEQPAVKKKRGRLSKKPALLGDDASVTVKAQAPAPPSKITKAVDPSVAQIQALVEEMRAKVSKS